MTSATSIALEYIKAGISVIPIRGDASKAPACSWKRFQERIATDAEIRDLFRNGCGVAAITGKVSGHLEVIDFEAGAPFHEWFSLIETHDSTLSDRLVIINTPSG